MLLYDNMLILIFDFFLYENFLVFDNRCLGLFFALLDALNMKIRDMKEIFEMAFFSYFFILNFN